MFNTLCSLSFCVFLHTKFTESTRKHPKTVFFRLKSQFYRFLSHLEQFKCQIRDLRTILHMTEIFDVMIKVLSENLEKDLLDGLKGVQEVSNANLLRISPKT